MQLKWQVYSGPVHTTKEKLESAALFLWLGLPSTLVRHEKHLMHFQGEVAVFKFSQRSVDGAPILYH